MKRSIKIDVVVCDAAKRLVVDSIRLYRAACRKAYSACAMAEMAGSEIIIDEEKGITIKPGKAAKEILTLAFGVAGKAHCYELRKWLRELHPSWMSIVPESMHYDIVSPKWKAKDPEFPKASNGYLVMNGVRSMPRFEHIGIPIKNTVPKIQNHSVFIKWDYDIGEMEFKLGRLDGARYHTWKNIRDKTEGWRLGQIFVNERDSKLFLTISYTAPDKEIVVDENKAMNVWFGDESAEMFINCEGSQALQGDKISVVETIDGLNELRLIAERYEKCRESAGNPRRVWGSRKIFDGVQARISNITRRRELYQKDRNHLWSRRIVDNARRWKCGRIVVANVPEREMFTHPWNWSQFKFDLNYKAEEIGAKVQYVDLPKEEKKVA